MGQKAFDHFALFKVARRKAGTLSGRCRSNGYVPKNAEMDGFTAARSRSQPSYLVSDYSALFAARQRGVEDVAAPLIKHKISD